MKTTNHAVLGALLALLLASCGAPPDRADYALSLPAAAVTTQTGESLDVEVEVLREGAFTSAVALSLPSPPAGVSAERVVVDGGATRALLEIDVAEGTEPGTYPLVVRGASLGLERTATLSLVVVRPSGTEDLAFGDGGVARLPAAERVRGVATDADANLVTVAAGAGAAPDFVVARFGPGGVPDAGFGDGGVARTDLFGGADVPEAVALDDGAIVVVGSAQDPSREGAPFSIVVVRYRDDGSLDPAFGAGGVATLTLDARYSFGYDLALFDDPDSDASGVVVVGRGREPGAESDALVLASFGGDGAVLGGVFLDLGTGVDEAFAVRFDDAGRLVVAGRARDGGGEPSVVLLRLDTAGTLDPTFGDDGVVRTRLAGGDFVTLLLEEVDEASTENRILVGGYVERNGVPKAAVERYRPDGARDATFSGNGLLVLGLPGESRVAALGYDRDAHLLIAGTAGALDTDESAALLALAGEDGALDPEFNKDGVYLHPAAGSEAWTVAADPGGGVVLGGAVGGGGALVRVLPD